MNEFIEQQHEFQVELFQDEDWAALNSFCIQELWRRRPIVAEQAMSMFASLELTDTTNAANGEIDRAGDGVEREIADGVTFTRTADGSQIVTLGEEKYIVSVNGTINAQLNGEPLKITKVEIDGMTFIHTIGGHTIRIGSNGVDSFTSQTGQHRDLRTEGRRPAEEVCVYAQ